MKAAFLGDANFAQSALEHERGVRHLLILDLFERYSALAFTVPSDRAVAILGLEKRVAQVLYTHAACGSLETMIYFGLSILWKRHQPEDMMANQQLTWRVPTWSWCSMSGRIQYMKLESNKIEWRLGEFDSLFVLNPWFLGASFLSRRDAKSTTLKGFARRVDVSDDEISSHIVFDRKNKLTAEDIRVVVICRDREEGGGMDAKAHVLVIYKREGRYERAGVASLPGKHISDKGVMVDIW